MYLIFSTLIKMNIFQISELFNMLLDVVPACNSFVGQTETFLWPSLGVVTIVVACKCSAAVLCTFVLTGRSCPGEDLLTKAFPLVHKIMALNLRALFLALIMFSQVYLTTCYSMIKLNKLPDRPREPSDVVVRHRRSILGLLVSY